MERFIKLFKKVHGVDVLKQYAQSHVLISSTMTVLLNGTSKKSLEIVRLSVSNKIVSRLRRKYKNYITNYIQKNGSKNFESCLHSDTVWFCWLQGLDNAPAIVKKCYKSLKQNITGKTIEVITLKNYKEFITFPDYIQKKIDNGDISKTHFSDLLRLELLIKYGGTWIDSTVYCSGKNIPQYYLDADLFLFQNLKPGLDGQATRISSWFITSRANNPILKLTRALLYEYWKNNSKLIDYFLFHDFFELAIEAYPEEWKKVIPIENGMPHVLLLRLFDVYDDELWTAIKSEIPFHKLTYKFDINKTKLRDTYFKKIFGD